MSTDQENGLKYLRFACRFEITAMPEVSDRVRWVKSIEVEASDGMWWHTNLRPVGNPNEINSCRGAHEMTPAGPIRVIRGLNGQGRFASRGRL